MAARSDADVAAWLPPDVHLRERIADCRDKLPPQPARALAARLEDAGALDDRVVHHATVLRTDGDSYRLKAAKAKSSRRRETATK